MSKQQTTPTYVLGQSETEQKRLILQSQFYEALTKEILIKAGVGSGMRVLDLGCGVGDVSLLVASLVGSTGSVLGVDRASESLEYARLRASQAKLENVTFLEADITNFVLNEPVDAIVGRFILLYLSNPASALRKLCKQVKPGGLIVFQEMDMTTARSVPSIESYEQSAEWIRETFRRGGVTLDMGSRLFSTFCQADLPEPKLLLRARIEGTEESPAYEYVAQTLRSLLPFAEKLGVTTAQEVQIENLADKIRDEVTKAQAVIILPSLIGAWTRLPTALV